MFDTQKPTPPPSNLPVSGHAEDLFGNDAMQETKASELEPTHDTTNEVNVAPPPPQDTPKKTMQNSDATSGGVGFVNGEMTNAPSALDAGKIKPIASASLPNATHVSPQPLLPNADYRPSNSDVMIHESFFLRHKVLIIGFAGLCILVPIILAVISLFMRGNVPVKPVILTEELNDVSTPPTTVTIPEPITPKEEPVLTDTPEVVPQPIEPPPSLIQDSDGDGLTDEQENIVNTDPLKTDTDGDGLTDKEEINIWKSDPRKTDTDGDTFSDGQEIKNGYNPLGAGRLFEIPK